MAPVHGSFPVSVALSSAAREQLAKDWVARIVDRPCERPRPVRIIETRLGPAVRDRIVHREAKLAAGRQLGERMDAPEMRGVVDVTVFDHVVGMRERRDHERLRFP